MNVLGIILIIVAMILFIIRQIQAQEFLNLKSARHTNIGELISTANSISQEIGSGDWRDYVKIWGKITVNEPILSELKQEPCVYYQMRVQREYEERETTTDSNGNRQEKMVKKTETISENKRSIPFFLEDKTGNILVNPDNAKIDTIKVLDEFRQESAGELLQFGSFSLMLNNRGFRNDRRTLGYHYTEYILPVGQEVLIIGQVSDETGDLRIIKPNNNKEMFMISLKTHEALVHSYGESQKYFLLGSIVCTILGIILIVISIFDN